MLLLTTACRVTMIMRLGSGEWLGGVVLGPPSSCLQRMARQELEARSHSNSSNDSHVSFRAIAQNR